MPESPHEMLARIKKNPAQFPALNTLLYMSEIHHADRGQKLKEFLRAAVVPAGVGLAVGLAFKRMSANLPDTRRNFVKALALGSISVAAGRTGDVASTRMFLDRFATRMEQIQRSPHFQSLPSEVRSALSPPTEATEANPVFDHVVSLVRSDKGALTAIGAQTAFLIALTALGTRDWKQKKFSRRDFLAFTTGGTAGFLTATWQNLTSDDRFHQHLSTVERELQLLQRNRQ